MMRLLPSFLKNLGTGLLVYPSVVLASVESAPLSRAPQRLATPVDQLSGSGQLVSGIQSGQAAGSGFIEGIIPLRRQGRQRLFLQGGYHRYSQQNPFSLGLGQRYLPSRSWGWGSALFFDQGQLPRYQRLSVGLEAWYSAWKLSANYYWPTGGWRSAPAPTASRQRPARGLDVQLYGYLPSCPQWAATVRYAHYWDPVTLGDQSRWLRAPRLGHLA